LERRAGERNSHADEGEGEADGGESAEVPSCLKVIVLDGDGYGLQATVIVCEVVSFSWAPPSGEAKTMMNQFP
jgi:hypothetical protein